MKNNTVASLTRLLKVLVIAAFICNLLAFFFVPGMAMTKGPEELLELGPYANPLEVPLRLLIAFALAWLWVWQSGGYEIVLTLFLLFCGCCTAVILWQAKRVLNTVLAGETFSLENARNMKRAAVCCLLIALAALIRLIWGFITYQSVRPLLTYNALFVPVFAMGFLLCMVMSALFRQAAEMKAENDLTI